MSISFAAVVRLFDYQLLRKRHSHTHTHTDTQIHTYTCTQGTWKKQKNKQAQFESGSCAAYFLFLTTLRSQLASGQRGRWEAAKGRGGGRGRHPVSLRFDSHIVYKWLPIFLWLCRKFWQGKFRLATCATFFAFLTPPPPLPLPTRNTLNWPTADTSFQFTVLSFDSRFSVLPVLNSLHPILV